MTAPLLHCQNVRFGYADGFALRADDVAVGAGDRIACLGPSGSGKSTFLHLLSGILLPQSGEVLQGGESWTARSEAGRRSARIRTIGLVFQSFELLDYLSVLDNVLVPYHVQPALRLDSAARDRAGALLATTGIAKHASKKPGALSQGERQRVALCRALVAEPTVVLADEPTGNLDSSSAATVLDLMLEQVTARNTALVMVTHDERQVDRFDRVLRFEVDGNGETRVIEAQGVDS